MEPLCISIAKKMLLHKKCQDHDLPEDLEAKLLEAELMVKKVKPCGCLSSTQTIATIILQWEMERTLQHCVEGDDNDY